MSDPRLELTYEGEIARLTIRRPDKLNALDAEMMAALVGLAHEVEQSSARVLILQGEGGRAFSAGGDIAAWSAETPEAFGRHWVRDGHVALDALAQLAIPVIAAIDGHCLGGGLELAATADYRIAEAQVTFGQPETRIGIIPGWSGTQRAVRRFGAQIVRRMALFGEVLTAAEAEAAGIVDKVVPEGQAGAAALALAEQVLDRAPRATEVTKMLINAAEGEEGGRILESLAGSIAAASDDLQLGLAAFRAKRKPDFRRR